MHNKMLDSVVGASMSFHDKTAKGVLNNRFTQDITAVDFNVPWLTQMFVGQIIYLLFSALVICFTSPLSIVVIVPLSIFMVRLLVRYTRSSRNVKR